MTKLGFDEVLRQLKGDDNANRNFSQRFARAGWNGKDMFIYLVPGSTFNVNRTPLNHIYPEGTEINYLPHIDIRTVDGKFVPWLPSQTDILAEDWYKVECST